MPPQGPRRPAWYGAAIRSVSSMRTPSGCRGAGKRFDFQLDDRAKRRIACTKGIECLLPCRPRFILLALRIYHVSATVCIHGLEACGSRLGDQTKRGIELIQVDQHASKPDPGYRCNGIIRMFADDPFEFGPGTFGIACIDKGLRGQQRTARRISRAGIILPERLTGCASLGNIPLTRRILQRFEIAGCLASLIALIPVPSLP